jgi:hypothetical protein
VSEYLRELKLAGFVARDHTWNSPFGRSQRAPNLDTGEVENGASTVHSCRPGKVRGQSDHSLTTSPTRDHWPM